MFTIHKELLKQFFRKPFTNLFPSRHAPKSVNKFLEEVKIGKKKINPPVAVPPGFRGKIKYLPEICIGCKLCTKVCPAKAVVFKPKIKKIEYHLFRCTFCGECVEICPVKALVFTDEFLLSAYDKE